MTDSYSILYLINKAFTEEMPSKKGTLELRLELREKNSKYNGTNGCNHQQALGA